MTKRRIILYWLLLLIPTGLIGSAVFQLLLHEQERIEQQTRSAARNRILTLADSFQLTVADVQEQMAAALHKIRGPLLEQTLIAWETNNPLVRHVFIWRPDTGLVLPRPESTTSLEMGNFIQRYRRMFQGQTDWKVFEQQMAQTEAAAVAIQGSGSPENTFSDSAGYAGHRSAVSPRRSLVDLAKGKLAQTRSAEGMSAEKPAVSAVWIPWYVENQLYILGWVRNPESGMVYGVELEMMTLLSRLLALFPPLSDIPSEMVFTLNDGHGRILHQVGASVPETDQRPVVTVALVPHLPHWQLAAFIVDDGRPERTGSSFIVLSGLLLAILVIAILSGGALLTWQAIRNHKDARQKTSFVSNVSHELKTPLTSIRMYAELLNEGRVSDPGKKKRYLGIIVEESQRLTRLVNNVLEFSRLEQARKKYRMEPLQLGPFVKNVLESQRLRFETAGVELECNCTDISVTIQADRDALEQVLINLLDNGLKYAADGKKIVVGIDDCHPICRIIVADRGPGVPKSQQTKIFDKFHRVDDSLTTNRPGSGLGLSIALKLMKGMGGDLIYEAGPGGGSRFIAVLPCSSINPHGDRS